MTSPLILLPAIDIKAGQSVRVSAKGTEPTIGSPVDQALEFEQQGAPWLHLVDLDAAYQSGNNDEAIRQVINQMTIPVQLSGGITDQGSLDKALGFGATRVNLGSGSFADLDWVAQIVAQHGEQISVALDVRDDFIAPRGSGGRGPSLTEVLSVLAAANCRRVVVTDVSRDGSLQGPNLELLKSVLGNFGGAVIASGGVASLADIDALAGIGVEGAIIGKALYAGNFTLPQALQRLGGVR